MTNRLLTFLALALVFASVVLLAAAMQHSSDLIGVRSQPAQTMSSDINITGQSNRTDTGATDTSLEDTATSTSGPDLSLSQVPNIQEVFSAMSSMPEALNDPPDILLLALLLLALLLLAIVGYILWRRRRRRKAPAVVAAVPASTRPALEYHEGAYRLVFPQVAAGLPAVWGAGEALDLQVMDITGKYAGLDLSVDGGAARAVALEGGEAHLTLSLEKGDHRITARPKAGGEASWADVRIVDYREEIVHMFNDLYQDYRSGHAGTGDEMTARELETAMRRDMPEPLQKSLDDTVTLFEYANYSLYAIGRKDFVNMYKSTAGLMPPRGGRHAG